MMTCYRECLNAQLWSRHRFPEALTSSVAMTHQAPILETGRLDAHFHFLLRKAVVRDRFDACVKSKFMRRSDHNDN